MSRRKRPVEEEVEEDEEDIYAPAKVSAPTVPRGGAAPEADESSSSEEADSAREDDGGEAGAPPAEEDMNSVRIPMFTIPRYLRFVLNEPIATDQADKQSQRHTIVSRGSSGACSIRLWQQSLLDYRLPASEEDWSHARLLNKDRSMTRHSLAEHIAQMQKVIVIMCHGGYFAGIVFNGGKVGLHKCFHRYVVRKKQGKRQANRDRGGKVMKSTGSQIRREQEVKHTEEIRGLLTSPEWQTALAQAHKIFVHSPGPVNKRILFGDGPLDRNDVRMRSIPFGTERPSYTEAVRVFTVLTTLEVTPHDGAAVEALDDRPGTAPVASPNASQQPAASTSRGISVVVPDKSLSPVRGPLSALSSASSQSQRGYTLSASPSSTDPRSPATMAATRLVDEIIAARADVAQWTIGVLSGGGLEEVALGSWLASNLRGRGSGVRYIKRNGGYMWNWSKSGTL